MPIQLSREFFVILAVGNAGLKKLYFLFFLLTAVLFSAQRKQYWLIDGQTQQKKVVSDSAAAVKVLDSLVDHGFFFTRLENVSKDGLITKIVYDKGKNYNEGYVRLSDSVAHQLKLKSEFFTKNIDSLKERINQYYSGKGFAFNRIKSKYEGVKDNFPIVTLSLLLAQQRIINGFEIKGYEKVPKRFVMNLMKEFGNRPYNSETIQKISRSLENHPYVMEERSPQTLFTKESTTVYLYLKKKKSSTFDGVIGFGNDQNNKFTLNGTLNVSLQNIFNSFEAINLFWQRNPDKGQTFDLKVDTPYLFNSNVGFNGNINIYRQDSLYANVKLLPSFYYNFSLRQRLGIRANIEVSSVLSDSYTAGQDYNKAGIGLWYEYAAPTDVDLFVRKTFLHIEGNILNATYQKEGLSATQTAYLISAENNFHLVGNNYFNVKGESAMIHSKIPLVENELLRFGGWNSLRGFDEKSLLSNFYAYGGGEYRYVIGQQAFFDLFAQVGYLRNSFTNLKSKLYSFGTGFDFRLPIGIMSFQISTGNVFGNPVRFRDLKVHWGLVSKF